MMHRGESHFTAKKGSATGRLADRPFVSLAARTLVAGAVFVLTLIAPANAVWIGKNSANQNVTVDLHSAGPANFRVLATGTSNNLLSLGTGTFAGNIGDAHINPAIGGGTINGNVFLGNGIDASGLVGHGTINGTVFSNQDSFLSQPLADASAAATAALSLKATKSLAAINDSWFNGQDTKTITGSVGTNVLKLSSINLTQGQTLLLSAPVGGSFVLVVNGQFNLSNSSSIMVDTSSGLLPLDVLYALGNNANLSASGTASRASIIDGIILAKAGNINISFGQVNGEVIGSCDLVFSNSSTSNGFSPIPEVSSFLPLLGFFSLTVIGQLFMRRRSLSLLAA